MSKFPGTPARHELPGGYSMRRNLPAAGYPAWTGLNFRDPGWMPACAQLTAQQAVDVASRGEVKRVDVRLVSGAYVRVANVASPGDQWNSASSTLPVVRSDYGNWIGQSSIWLASGTEVPELEIEITFDLPDADEI
jgi:hypothetical protein